MDEARRTIADAAIAVDAGRIVWMGPSVEAAARFAPRERLDAAGKIAMPGMIDAHFHTAQQFLRGKLSQLSRRQPLKIPIWKNYYVPFEGILDPEDVYLSGLFAYANMLMVGTTCFAEAGGPHPDEMGRAADEIGIRGLIALSTVDSHASTGAVVPDSMMMTRDQAIERNIALVQRWKTHPRVNASLALRQIIVCSPELITAIGQAAVDLDAKIHTHLCEGIYEIDFALQKFGMRPTEYLESLGVLSHHLHAAHSVILSPDEVDLYAKHRVSACHCGLNNYSLGAPRLVEMWRRGIDIGMGSDGGATAGTIDIFQVAHAAKIGQQVLAGTPWHIRTAISYEELLAVATNGGARALGMSPDIGQLSVGSKADILLVSCDDIDQQPLYDLMFTASSSVVGRDVRDVIVDGRVVVKDRELLSMDMGEIRAKVARRQPQLMERFERLVGAQ
ncbi:amidohydrolase family protein [Ketogulonicigenium robustum]|nr:amidohydrolase family protein [Ketogulonicigenium robustum]